MPWVSAPSTEEPCWRYITCNKALMAVHSVQRGLDGSTLRTARPCQQNSAHSKASRRRTLHSRAFKTVHSTARLEHSCVTAPYAINTGQSHSLSGTQTPTDAVESFRNGPQWTSTNVHYSPQCHYSMHHSFESPGQQRLMRQFTAPLLVWLGRYRYHNGNASILVACSAAHSRTNLPASLLPAEITSRAFGSRNPQASHLPEAG